MAKIKTIKVPRVSFALGDEVLVPADEWVRPLYGPANESGGRQLVGWIKRGAPDVEQLLDMIDYADAHQRQPRTKRGTPKP